MVSWEYGHRGSQLWANTIQHMHEVQQIHICYK